MALNPHPSSLAMQSAQFMADARRLDAVLTDMEKTSRNATEDEKLLVKTIWQRMPERIREELRPAIKKLGITLD